MILFLRQIWALIRKNLLIIIARRPISTFIRAIALPLVIVLVIAYSKTFFASSQVWGISEPHAIRSLKAGLAASSGHDIVGFVDNGMKGGAVSSLIDSLSQITKDAGKTPRLYATSAEMVQDCAANNKGLSPCYGTVIFWSSPNEGTLHSSKGVWNYTLRADGSIDGSVNVGNNNNGAEVYLLPLQRAIDTEIVSRSQAINKTTLPDTVNNILFTPDSQAQLTEQRDGNYLALCIYLFGALFSFAMVGIVYHMTAFVASERELGMSGLIDTMIPGASNIRAQLARQISTYISFAIVYLPSWLTIGIVISLVVFPESSREIPIGYHVLSGLAFTSFSLFGSSFFKKAQLSGSIMVVVAIVTAVLPQVLYDQTRTTCLILSLLFPSSNYTYFITGLATFESGNGLATSLSNGLFSIKVDMMRATPDLSHGTPPGSNVTEVLGSKWRVELYLYCIFLMLQILVYPILAFFLEQALFSKTSSKRTFSTPTSAEKPTISLSAFCKTYKPSILGRIFKRNKSIHAVIGIELSAYQGQIFCLLGPNGSGKSTTLNCISGQEKVTSGNISIDPSGGIGYAPQANVIWPDLTVAEHIHIFSNLKCISDVNSEVISELVRMCDLEKKLTSKAKTLSGGQKRKLQLAMMFAGGSKVCCVDEVSTGLDPISRRRIWEILLAERGRRTIIMTALSSIHLYDIVRTAPKGDFTHFLDEADFLADNIAIMYKGLIRAAGTSSTLKNSYGNGYTIKLPQHVDYDIMLSGPVEKETARYQVVYRVATAALAAELVEFLEKQQIQDYQVSGPTFEELFLKVTGDTIHSNDGTSAPEPDNLQNDLIPIVARGEHDLLDGRPISAVKQWWILFCKRFRILRRRYIPYFVAVAFAIAGAAVAPLLIKSFNYPMLCPTPDELVFDYSYRSDFGSSGKYSNYVFGPASSLDDQMMAQMAEVYSVNNTQYYGGYSNGTQLKESLLLVDSLEEFTQLIQTAQNSRSSVYSSGTYIYGGIWVGDGNDDPTVVFNTQVVNEALNMQNFLNNILSGVKISAAFLSLPSATTPTVFDYKPLLFIIYYGLICAAYPSFFALYPTNERISNVRSMQYSNGIRPLPLWLSHLAFDGIFITIISIVAIALISVSTPVWVGLGYLWLIIFLYGIVAALLSYVISMFAKSPVTAWFMISFGQVVFYFAYFGGLIGIQSKSAYEDLEGSLNSLYFGLGIISPVVNLERAFTIGLGQFAALCNEHSLASIYLFGGPILYLVLQIILLFTLLLWWDSSFTFPSFGRRKFQHDSESSEMQSADLMEELKRLSSRSADLRVETVSKSFGKNVALDNVTFAVQTSEIFALLGPNGAGKSTVISMIRGDLKPSTSNSSIHIANHSILTSPVTARANLGVCPQFDSADVLTVTETLRFFAKMRGVSKIDHNVAIVISACGLEAWAHQLAHKLSGGTKRKLSLAVALVGNPKVLVLDEPSSALDANAKRNMWHTLQRVSKNRAVVLTTHSMEEADALADRIGIVSSRMLAIGGREELKKRAGDAFHGHLVSRSAPRTSPEELQLMKSWILETFPNAKISRETQGGQVRFEVPAEGHNFGELLRTLEAAKGDLGVEFYSVGKATLDEVFENIVKRYGNETYQEK